MDNTMKPSDVQGTPVDQGMDPNMPQEQEEMKQLLEFIASLDDRITALEDLVKK
jgi:hypothetical protein